MLTDLTIKNIAIIDTLHINFKSGLTALTGETGAGKSIIIDAVGLIMGGRAFSELIRSGQDEAVVEALFELTDCPGLMDFLTGMGFDGSNELLIKRSISRTGKNRIFINGSMATLTQLGDIAPRLINIYGQHESQTLLKPENHLLLLDAFGKAIPLREEFAACFARLSAINEQLELMAVAERDAERRIDMLGFQTEEIARAGLHAGEEEVLEERRQLLSNAEKLATTSGEAYERLYGGDGAILGQLRRISISISDLSRIDPSLQDAATALEASYLQLEDAAMTLRDYASHIEADPASLQQVDDRLDLIGQLKKKYGATIDEIISYQKSIDRELGQLRSRERNRIELETEKERLSTELLQHGALLTTARINAGRLFNKALESELHQLAMKGAIIETALEPLAQPRSSGLERVEFLFSPNPGEPPRPLGKIASGGELSRLMLAIKQILPENDVPTLVFDEVDTGISGATSELVGMKLKNVATRQQVLCITHLPQVTACATNHLRVEKLIKDGRTSTAVNELDPAGRTLEIARMIAGTTITDSARKHAAEMLASASAPNQ